MAKRVIRAGEIDRALSNIYADFFATIRKDKSYPWDLIAIKAQYGDQIYSATRKAITTVYTVGLDYVATKLKADTYPSDTDLLIIKDQTDTAVKSFWGRITEDSKRAREQEVQKERQLKDRETESFLGTVSQVAIFSSLALSTISKSKQLQGKRKVRWVTQFTERTCKELPNGDPGCKYLDGQEWDEDDPTIPIPGKLGSDGTHPNCNCYIDIII